MSQLLLGLVAGSRHVTAMCCHDKSGMPESLSRYYFAPVPSGTGCWLHGSSSKSPPLFFPLSLSLFLRAPSQGIPYCHAILIARAAAEYYRDGKQKLRSRYLPESRERAQIPDINAGDASVFQRDCSLSLSLSLSFSLWFFASVRLKNNNNNRKFIPG